MNVPQGTWTIQHTCRGDVPKTLEFSAAQYTRYNVFVRYGVEAQTIHFLTEGMVKAKRDGWVTIIPDPDVPVGSIELKNQGVSLGYAKSLDFQGDAVAALVGTDGTVTVTPNVTQWIRGNGIPLNTLGSNGMYYEEVATGQVYYKSGGIWSITNIHGVSGPEVQVDFSDNTTINEVVGNKTTTRAVFLDYTIEVIGTYESGRMMVVHDGTVANVDLQYLPSSPPVISGLTYSASIVGNDIVLTITALNVGSILRFRYRRLDFISNSI